MPRVKRGVAHVKRRHNLLKRAKGFKWGRKNRIRLAKTAVTRAGVNAYRGRRQKKRLMKANWAVSINAGSRPLGITYSRLRAKLREQKIELDRKSMSELAKRFPAVFEKLVQSL
ncbi:MAG: 50S ribosomal protein L20 [Patescibacteria group bacterium]|jgi:large subunit ribosomal protein L20